MTLLDLATLALSASGAFFFLAGTVGLIRLPDTCTRLHALTKADTLGLGLVVLALVIRADSVAGAGKLLLVWLLALLASTNACYMLGRWALHHQQKRDDR